TDTRSPRRLSSARAAISGAGADFLRHPGARHFDLAVPVGHPLSVGRTVYADRRRHQGGEADAGSRRCRCPHWHRPVRLFRRAVPPRLVSPADHLTQTSTFAITAPVEEMKWPHLGMTVFDPFEVRRLAQAMAAMGHGPALRSMERTAAVGSRVV